MKSTLSLNVNANFVAIASSRALTADAIIDAIWPDVPEAVSEVDSDDPDLKPSAEYLSKQQALKEAFIERLGAIDVDKFQAKRIGALQTILVGDNPASEGFDPMSWRYVAYCEQLEIKVKLSDSPIKANQQAAFKALKLEAARFPYQILEAIRA